MAGQVFIQQVPDKSEARASTAQIVGEARHAVQIATREVATGSAAEGRTITPVMTGTYVQSREAAGGGVEYVAFRD